MASTLDVYLEAGTRRVFAGAVEWPGWCRAARGEEAALRALGDYAPRYACVVDHAGMTLPADIATALSVVETVTGTATTDFGAPDAVAEVDRRPLDAESGGR